MSMVDDGLFKWIVGGIIGGFVLATSHIHVRINRAEDRREKDKEEQAKRRQKLYDGLDAHRKELTSFKETVFKEYPTKADMKNMEDRIIGAIPKL